MTSYHRIRDKFRYVNFTVVYTPFVVRDYRSRRGEDR